MRTLGEIGENVEVASASARTLQRRNRSGKLGDDRLVENLFAGERTVLRRQRAILECLQLGRDVALGVLQRLPAAVIVGHARGVRMRDLDVEPVDLVVFDLEIGDAGALALARLQCYEELAAVGVDRTELVEIGVVAARDHATVPDLRRRLGHDRALQQIEPARVDVEVCRKCLCERRGNGSRVRADRR